MLPQIRTIKKQSALLQARRAEVPEIQLYYAPAVSLFLWGMPGAAFPYPVVAISPCAEDAAETRNEIAAVISGDYSGAFTRLPAGAFWAHSDADGVDYFIIR